MMIGILDFIFFFGRIRVSQQGQQEILTKGYILMSWAQKEVKERRPSSNESIRV